VADLSDLRRAVGERTAELANAALQVVLADTLDAAPERTGNLKALTDVSASTMVGEFTASGTIFSLAPYAGYTDAGTEPHIIEGNPLLYFYWDRVGRFMVLPYVNHPGTQGTQWFNGGNPDGEPMASRWERALVEVADA
jgi:hypothetical protein